MLFILTLISGGRNETDLASVFVLTSCTMAGGYITELYSRPDPDSGGTRWMGQRVDNTNRFKNYVARMHIHVGAFVPYATVNALPPPPHEPTPDTGLPLLTDLRPPPLFLLARRGPSSSGSTTGRI